MILFRLKDTRLFTRTMETLAEPSGLCQSFSVRQPLFLSENGCEAMVCSCETVNSQPSRLHVRDKASSENSPSRLRAADECDFELHGCTTVIFSVAGAREIGRGP